MMFLFYYCYLYFCMIFVFDGIILPDVGLVCVVFRLWYVFDGWRCSLSVNMS